MKFMGWYFVKRNQAVLRILAQFYKISHKLPHKMKLTREFIWVLENLLICIFYNDLRPGLHILACTTKLKSHIFSMFRFESLVVPQIARPDTCFAIIACAGLIQKYSLVWVKIKGGNNQGNYIFRCIRCTSCSESSNCLSGP